MEPWGLEKDLNQVTALEEAWWLRRPRLAKALPFSYKCNQTSSYMPEVVNNPAPHTGSVYSDTKYGDNLWVMTWTSQAESGGSEETQTKRRHCSGCFLCRPQCVSRDEHLCLQVRALERKTRLPGYQALPLMQNMKETVWWNKDPVKLWLTAISMCSKAFCDFLVMSLSIKTVDMSTKNS